MKLKSGQHLLLPATFLLTSAACLFSSVAVPPSQARSDPKREGAAIFASSGCGHCHGDSGQGTAKGPSLRDLRKRMSSDVVMKQIRDGGKSMPPFGDTLDDKQIKNLMKFLRARHPEFQPASTSQH